MSEYDIDVGCAGDGCGKECEEGFNHGDLLYHHWARKDAYGLFTGLYCDSCYKSNYPFRKDDYHDPMYAGERMEPEDNLPWEY
jgi:hypothetical protein